MRWHETQQVVCVARVRDSAYAWPIHVAITESKLHQGRADRRQHQFASVPACMFAR